MNEQELAIRVVNALEAAGSSIYHSEGKRVSRRVCALSNLSGKNHIDLGCATFINPPFSATAQFMYALALLKDFISKGILKIDKTSCRTRTTAIAFAQHDVTA